MPLAFIAKIALPFLGSIFTTLAPLMAFSLGFLLNFAISKIPKIPQYIEILTNIYKDSAPGTETRKVLTAMLLGMGGIATFMAHSFVPFTAVPVIGAITGPIAILFATCVIFITLDLVLAFNKDLEQDIISRYGKSGQDIVDDLATIKHNMGPKWDEARQKVQILVNDVSPQISELEEKLTAEGKNFSVLINDYFNGQIRDLVLYIDRTQTSQITLNESDIKIITDSLEPWQKVNASLFLGATAGIGVGLGTSSIASSIFVPATIWTPITSFLGLQSGVVVGATTFTMLTAVAPALLGVGIGAGIFGSAMYAINEREKNSLSDFLGDVVIASLPMARIDGELTQTEKDAIHQILMCAAIREKDQKRVTEALEACDRFEDIISKRLLHEDKPEKAAIKNKLLLSMSWEIAKADGKIDDTEAELHDRMGRILQVPQETTTEIRRLLTPAYGMEVPKDPSPQQKSFFGKFSSMFRKPGVQPA